MVPSLDDARVAVIGLGYVGLPLAVAFGHHFPTTGFDINARRIAQLREGRDVTGEISREELDGSRQLTVTDDLETLKAANVYIVTVPTPIDEAKRPDMRALVAASETVGRGIGPGDVVIYESTVYPGATEEVCVPVVERVSGLRYREDFHAGYSPERINPGDREHRVTDIVKVTSGSCPDSGAFVDALYGRVITVGTHRASSIRVAEAAKVIENTQRDLNIALVNELSLIFDRLGIDTLEVLEAAGTKWNFLPFRPGLVGGHCIGVDPYYLTHKAQAIGYHPEVILAGRRINDDMGRRVAERLVKLMLRRGIQVVGARVLVLGLTFKENCPDLRNTRVVDVIAELESYGLAVDVHDPWVDPEEAREEYELAMTERPEPGAYDGIVVAVAHREFREWGPERMLALARPERVVFDLKGVLPPACVDARL